MRLQDKNKYMHIRIEHDVKDRFSDYCKDNLTTPSIIIRDFINKLISADGKVNK